MKETMPKIFRILLSSIMIVFVVLQFNDPDAIGWILMYGSVAILGVFGSERQNHIRCYVSMGYIGFAWWLFPTVYYGVGQMNVVRPEIEQARESLGVLIAAGINGINAWLHRVEARSQDATQ